MKRALLLFLFCVSGLHAGERITATITVTNAPADGDTIVVNGDTRTWKTTVATPATQITIGAAIGAHATNMFNQFAGNRFTTLQLSRSGTNGVVLKGIVGQTMALSISGTWGFYTLSTNQTTNSVFVTTPAAAYQSQDAATGTYSQIPLDLGTYSTNALATGTTLVGNLVQTSGNQTVAGVKTFTGNNVYSGSSQSYRGGEITNSAIRTAHIYFDGTNPNGLHFYDSAVARQVTIAPDADGFPTLYLTTLSEVPSITLGTILYSTLGDILYGGLTNANTWSGTNSFAQITNTPIYSASISNDVEYAGGPAMVTVSSLANGNNAACPFGGYRFVRLTAGPTGAFTINGIAGGGVRELWVYNNTGQNMTVAHQSGTDPTATNRIVSLTGADQSTTADGSAYFIYDTTNSRWVLMTLSP